MYVCVSEGGLKDTEKCEEGSLFRERGLLFSELLGVHHKCTFVPISLALAH